MTDGFLSTKYPHIFAAGDVAGPFQFTHAASHQAWYASINALIRPFWRFKANYDVIPRTTFLDPEISRVGLNEKEAQAKGMKKGEDYDVTTYPMDDLDRAITESATKGFVKVLTAHGKDKILGVTIASENSGELLAEFTFAMKHGLGLNKILSTIHTYPTMAEANKYVAGKWKQKTVSPKLLKIAERYFAFWR